MAFDTVIDKAQLEGAITASANAIREKTGDTALIEWLADKGFAEAIAAIQAGGDVRIETGTVTFAEDQTRYTFWDEDADIFILYSANTEAPIHTDRQGIVAMVRKPGGMWTFGYNRGTKKYYAPYYSNPTGSYGTTCSFNSNNFNSYLLASASPYVWYAIWGVS